MKDNFDMNSNCLPGGYPRTMQGYQSSSQHIGPHSPPPGWQYPPSIPNQTPSSEDRQNDSGINSGSDCHSSSPGSENGVENCSSPNGQTAEASNTPYYSTPVYPRAAYHCSSIVAPMMYPGAQPAQFRVKSEPEDHEDTKLDTTLTETMPSTFGTPSNLRNLEMSIERNFSLSSSSPGVSEHSADEDKRSENGSADENGHRVPRVNSHGKVKTFKCKQCPFVAITKFDFWTHQRQHIKPEKLLTCHKCPFVTEYKHHLEYHLRNHDGSKPFKCEHCDYTCVNKSMLNSHKKSHSNIYQYRCAECHYASKYCHSLKLHLRKYNHQPAMVLNPDGSPNPLPIIDVYGTRRGPKVKPLHEEEGEPQSQQPRPKKPKTENMVPPSTIPLPLQQLMAQAPPMQQIPLAYTLFQQAMIYQNLERLARERMPSGEGPSRSSPEPIPSTSRSQTDVSGPLDLTVDSNSNYQETPSYKLDTPSTSSDEEDEESSTTMFENVEVVQNDSQTNVEEKEKPKPNDFTCQYCCITFGDAVLYTMHMGYHGYQDPFACNMCGEKCGDKVSFFLHIARTPHS